METGIRADRLREVNVELATRTLNVEAAELDVLVARRLHMLTGTHLDATIPEVTAALKGVERAARQLQRSFQRSPKRQILWTDLAHLKPLSNAISSQYLNLRSMALAWATRGQGLYRNAALLHDIRSGLEWLSANEFNAHSVEAGNWYDFEIAAPRCLTDILVLLGDELSATERRRYLRPVKRFESDPEVIDPRPGDPEPSTGPNRTDKALVDLFQGLLLKDARTVTTAVNAIRSVFRDVTAGDGFYADGSFVFHGFFPYTGNYGVVLLSDVADALYLLNGSRWDLGRRRRATTVRWTREAFVPLLYRGAMMDMVRGRLISYRSAPSHAVGHRFIAACLRLSQTAAVTDAAALRSLIKRWCQEDRSRSYADSLPLDLIVEARRILDSPSIVPAEPLALSHVFASMDRVVHLRPDFAVGIAMHSTRIQNYESINGNDLDGWHTSDGMLYLYDADLLQFDGNFWPTVDPERLPGTTVIARSRPPEGQFGGSSAVGGTSLDRYSAVMMQLNVFQGRLQAKKSWFLFDDEVAALGADIQCTVAGRRVETVIENRRLRAARAKALVRRPGADWANLPASSKTAPIGYFFPRRASIKSRREKRTGSWRDIDGGLSPEKLSSIFQTIWIDHGVKPKHAEYAYVLLPGKDAAATKAYAANPAVRIIQNNAEAQAVAHTMLRITAVNFWKPGVSVEGITTNAVCSVIVRRVGARLTIAVSDPTQAHSGTIDITIAASVAGTISADRGIKVERRTRSLKLSIHAARSAGKTFRAAFTVAR